MTRDIIAGIPSYNNEDTVAFVTEQIGGAMERYYASKSCIILNADGGSTDRTGQNFLHARTAIEKEVVQPRKGVTGKGNVFRLVFRRAVQEQAQAAIVNDSDLRSINPRWVKLQVDSILKGYDYATPYYSRYKYDGTITNFLCYPLIYGLFCQNIRQPIGGDFAFSSGLANHWLQSFWPKNTGLFGIDIFMTTNAILGNYKICQVNLQTKEHDAKDPGTSLSPMLRQVISTLFKIITMEKDRLREFKRVKEVPLLGSRKLVQPAPFTVDAEGIRQRYLKGFAEQEAMIKKVMNREDFMHVKQCAASGDICLEDAYWARVVYDYILAYKKHEQRSSSVLRALTPVWFGKIYTFMDQTKDMSTAQADKLIARQAKEFHKQRRYLLDLL